MVQTKIENSAIQLASASNVRNIWGNLIINVKAYGAKGDGVHDDAPAINAAIAAAQQNLYETVVEIPAGPYLIKTPINVMHGPYPHSLTIRGYGVRIVAGTANMTMMKIKSRGSRASFLNIGQTRIFGINFYGAGAGSTGILIGKDTSDPSDSGLDGGPFSVIRDCFFENLDYGVIQSESRLFQYENCLFSLFIAAIVFKVDYGGFCGDSWVTNCQLAAVTGIKIAPNNSGTCNGIHINDCVFYGSNGIDMTPGDTTSVIQDIWITNCAFDGTVSGAAINCYTVTKGNIGPIQISNIWINAYLYGINTYRTGSIHVIGGKISSIDNEGIILNDVTDCIVSGVLFIDANRTGAASGIVKLTGSGLRNKIECCSAVHAGAVFIIVDTAQDKFYIVGNSADEGTAVVNNAGGTDGVNYYIKGNL